MIEQIKDMKSDIEQKNLVELGKNQSPPVVQIGNSNS